MVRIGDFHHSEPCIKVGDIKQGAADDLAIFCFSKLVRAKTASSLAEISIRNFEGSYRNGVGLLRGVH
jgi:hypothetical protein